MPTGNGSILDRYWRDSRQNRYGVYLVVYVVVVLLLLGGVNYLTNRFNKSYDSTATHRLTLSDQSRKVAEALPGDISMRYFYSTGGAEPAKELLSRYAELSGKIHVDYVDMDQKPLEARAAERHRGCATSGIHRPRRQTCAAGTCQGTEGAESAADPGSPFRLPQLPGGSLPALPGRAVWPGAEMSGRPADAPDPRMPQRARASLIENMTGIGVQR